ncbi:2-oxoacid:acceptor oxidoreductase family protein [Sulfurimonas autotrophica]|uniref:2-oxoglutarate ferredoxin oxidoreductase, gamma subunit n=1 Tax=Sulfurimonas autotrophica (strain ATCC BAA-671 / DSM 16294 / JCM 11897 / OK10) TaxID=563040 RepID=E0USK6_SULAO|nr:2-oxoacid:acceptor oxidoreductase family protein [Sulfurimonas autotrophica]ADN09169.1 2-oxoglutarate ferredoxin oxidoreductase, gamma subunit [Sulfurimonas autotrophica DSM 16294]
MRHTLRFTGVGGQGVLLAGEIMAACKIKNGGYGLKTATYTSQVRGGATVVDITLDDEEIRYPYANEGEIDFMLSVADVSYHQFKNGVRPGNKIVVDPNLVHPTDEDRKTWEIIEIPIITIAKEEVGNVITQSVVALAITNTMTGVLPEESLVETMLSKVPKKVHEANIKAYALGKAYALDAMGTK